MAFIVPEKGYIRHAPHHLNDNRFVAVAIRTTGPYVTVHDIIEICILPLDSHLNLWKPLQPFLMELKPCREMDKDCKVSKADFGKALSKGIERDRAALALRMWFTKLMGGVEKRIVPVSGDWFKVGGFIHDWIGPHLYDTVFFPDYRDLCASAAYCNDRADIMAEPIPYPKVHLNYVLTTLKVERINRQDCLTECMAVAEAYRKILRMTKV